MSTNREQLIADWRKQLAEAAEIRPELSARSQWMTRLRIRLYRFLLSLYGEGDWQESLHLSDDETSNARSIGAVKELGFQGKPAKDAVAIRATLDSVAKARTSSNDPGSLVEGHGLEAWTIVATSHGGINPHRCAAILSARRIPLRVINRKDDVSVEVRVKHLTNARLIIQANIDRLRLFSRHLVPTRPFILGDRLIKVSDTVSRVLSPWSFVLVSLTHLALTVPLAYAWVLVGIALQPDEVSGETLFDEYVSERFWLAWRGLFIIVLLSIWLRAHWRARKQNAAQQLAARPSAAR